MMHSLAKNNVILQLALSSSITVRDRFRRGFDDLARLLNPDGRVYTLAGGIPLYWCGNTTFTSDPADPRLYVGNRVDALKELGDLFGAKDNSHIQVHNPMALFYFESLSTKINFEYQEEGDFKGVKVWDRYNETWRRFEILLDSQGLDINTDKPVTVWVNDAVTGTRINLDIVDKNMVNSWVEKEGNRGTASTFSIYSSHALFSHMRLVPLASDHPGFEVKEFQGDEIIDVSSNMLMQTHQHSPAGGNNMLNTGVRPGAGLGGPY